jgi:hypothetical protein
MRPVLAVRLIASSTLLLFVAVACSRVFSPLQASYYRIPRGFLLKACGTNCTQRSRLWRNQPHVTRGTKDTGISDLAPVAGGSGTNYTCSLAGKCTALTRSGTGGGDGHSIRPRWSASIRASG